MGNLHHRTAWEVAKLTVFQQMQGRSFSLGAAPVLPTHHGRQSWFLCLEDATEKEKMVAEQKVAHHRKQGSCYTGVMLASECQGNGPESGQQGDVTAEVRRKGGQSLGLQVN